MMRVFRIVVLIGLMVLLMAGVDAWADYGDIEIKDTDRSLSEDSEGRYDGLIERTSDKMGDAITKLVDGEAVDATMEYDFARQVWVFVFYIYDAFRSIFYFFLIFCEGLGWLIFAISTKNKARQKFAIRVFCFTLPIIGLLVRYGLPYVYIHFV